VALITAESGDQGRSTELLAISRKTTSREDGLGISWAESGLAFSPEQKKKRITISYFCFCFQSLLYCFELYLRFKVDKEDTKYSVTFLTGIRRSTSFWF
jgi:hypothetical protein